MELQIRPCEPNDLRLLKAEFTQGPSWLHEERLVEQERGESTYLITWVEGRPVGHLKVRWAGSVHDHVRRGRPHTPEIRRFAVLPEFRGQGIGGRLLAKAESLVTARGYSAVGLAVAVDNLGARRLYLRNGYQDWEGGSFESRWDLMEHDVVVGEHVHVATYMFKRLATLEGSTRRSLTA